MQKNIYFWMLLLIGSLAPCSALRTQDDRENSAPTGAIWYPSITAASLDNVLAQGWRITNLKLIGTSGPTFATALVANSGSYGRGWWWYFGQTETQVRNLLAANLARPIEIEPYLDGGNVRYAVVMISNTGAQQKNWWWVTGQTAGGVASAVTANNARIYDLDAYTTGGNTRYSAVLYSNTGTNARAWWFYFGVTESQLGALLSTNAARLIDVQRVDADAFNAVMYQINGKRWFYTGQSAQGVTDLLMNNGARLVCLDPFTKRLPFPSTSFSMGLTENLEPESRRINDLMRSTSDGFVGAYLKRANSGVRIAFNETRVIEPASTLKTVHHVRAMRSVLLGTADLREILTVNTGLINNSCPNDTIPVMWSLQRTLEEMMVPSDNGATKAITNRFGGFAGLNATAGALGMNQTSVKHHIGCGTPPNETTLADLGKLHEMVINGYLGAQRETFYDLMVNHYANGGYAEGRLNPVITQEAQAAGLSSTQEQAFRGQFFLATKKGGYSTATGFHRTWGSYFRIPFYNSLTGVTYREFVGGSFAGQASVEAAAIDAAATGAAEILRAELRAAMPTWRVYSGGSILGYGSSCTGTAGNPIQGGSGTPQVGGQLTYNLSFAPSRAPFVFYLGGSRTSFGASHLPVFLGIFGAPGCSVYVSLDLGLAGSADSGGNRPILLNVPIDPSLIRASLYTQFLVFDPGANALGVTTTRGMMTTLGSRL